MSFDAMGAYAIRHLGTFVISTLLIKDEKVRRLC